MGKAMKLKNYDPARSTDRAAFRYVVFPFDSEEVGERTVLIHPRALDGKSPEEVRAHVQHTYEVFRRAEEYAEAQSYAYTNEKAMERANTLYKSVFLVVTINCLNVYLARLDEDTEEARAEHKHLDRLDKKINLNECFAEAVEKSAEVLLTRWLEDNGPKHARNLVRAADFHMKKQLAAAAIFEADEQVLHDAPVEEWRAAFMRSYRNQLKDALKDFSFTYLQHEAQDILENDIKPVEMPLEELRLLAGVVWLEGAAADDGYTDLLTSSVNSRLARYTNTFFVSRYETIRDHSQPDLHEAEPSVEHRITSAQMDLMIYILLSSYDSSEGERPFVWSPKAYLGRSPTKTEAATLSRRMATLTQHGLIKKSGREASVTDYGKALIRIHTVKLDYDEALLKVRLVLDLNESLKNLEALKLVKDVARRHKRHDLIHRDTKGPLNELFYAELDYKNNLVQQLKEMRYRKYD